MKHEKTERPSFPQVEGNELMPIRPDMRWQVLCGDEQHWRMGVYAPEFGSREEIKELEWHDCPELFVLLSGRVTLVIADAGKLRELPLEHDKAVLVTLPHAGYCPDGAFSGKALVIERDAFTSEYRSIEAWLKV